MTTEVKKQQPKILNIDALAKRPVKSLTLNGVEYPVPEMTVENFIETTRIAEMLADKKAGAREQIEETVKMIVRSVPNIPEDALRKLSIEQLGVIVQFIQGDYDPNKDDAAGEPAGKADPQP